MTIFFVIITYVRDFFSKKNYDEIIGYKIIGGQELKNIF